MVLCLYCSCRADNGRAPHPSIPTSFRVGSKQALSSVAAYRPAPLDLLCMLVDPVVYAPVTESWPAALQFYPICDFKPFAEIA